MGNTIGKYVTGEIGSFFSGIENLFRPNPPKQDLTSWENLRGKPYVTVSAKGISNGLSDIYNDGADFGVDTPNTQSDGIGEALQYAIDHPTFFNNDIGKYWIPKVQLLSGYFTISKPIILKLPYHINNLTLEGIDEMSPYIGCAFNTTSSDTYPYAINIDSNDLDNLFYINIHWQNFQLYVPSGFTPYGFVNFDFSSVNTNQNVFTGYNLNVGTPGFVKAFNLLGFQQIHMYNFETYGSSSYFDAGVCEILGGFLTGAYIFIGGSMFGDYYSDSILLTPIGNCDNVVAQSTLVHAIGNSDSGGFTVRNLTISDATDNLGGSFIYFANSSGTITVEKLTVRNVRAVNLSGDISFITQISGGSHNVGIWDISGITSNNQYVWTDIPYNSPTIPTNPPASGTVYQNTNQYNINLSIPITYPTTSLTATTAWIRVGPSSTAGANPKVDEIAAPNTESTAGGRTITLKATVPAGQYFEVSESNATIGTAVVSAV
jgi:hypothetical protein